MSKPRLFGEQVVVKVLNHEGLAPFIIDFDTCDITSLSKIHSFKGIGRQIPKHQTINDGWKISLTRNKRDNALQSFIHHIDMLLEAGCSSPEFQVEHIVMHFAPTIDKEYVLGKDSPVKDKESIYENFKNITSKISSLPKLNIIGNSTFNTTVNAVLDDTKRYTQNAQNFLGSAESYLAQAKGIGLNYVNQIANIMGEQVEGMAEIYTYHFCAIAEPTISNKRNEEIGETLVLYSGTRTSKTVTNVFEDTYMKAQFASDYSTKFTILGQPFADQVGKIDVMQEAKQSLSSAASNQVVDKTSEVVNSVLEQKPIVIDKPKLYKASSDEWTGMTSKMKSYLKELGY